MAILSGVTGEQTGRRSTQTQQQEGNVSSRHCKSQRWKYTTEF